jgi:hypothetical protein
MEAMCYCRTFKITQDAFNGSPMRICGRMHKLTDFVNSKANIWSRKSEILKSTHNLMKACSIRKQRIWQYDSFGCRDRSINRFAR